MALYEPPSLKTRQYTIVTKKLHWSGAYCMTCDVSFVYQWVVQLYMKNHTNRHTPREARRVRVNQSERAPRAVKLHVGQGRCSLLEDSNVVLVSPSIIFMCLVHLDSVLCTYRDDGGPGTTFCDQKFDFD